jgi:superfamily II DNA or RNA helicase
VQVASAQTVLKHPHLLPTDVDYILADEAHHYGAGAEKWSALIGRYPGKRVVGLTATPERGDGTGMSPIFDAIVQSKDVPGLSVRRLTERGLLVPCHIDRPRTFLRLQRDDANALAQDPIDAWMAYAHTGRQGFIFFQTVNEAEAGCATLLARGVLARVVSDRTPRLERRAIIEGFRAGRIKCLCNVYVLTEGFDAPNASLCVLARNCGTAGMFLQIVGRILRSCEGKTDCVLVDLPGVSWVHGTPEDDRLWSLTGKASILVSGKSCPVCSKPVEEFPCTFCGHTPAQRSLLFGAQASNTVVLDEPLTRYTRALGETDEQRREALARWVLGRVIQKKHPYWAANRYREVYGVTPDATAYNVALASALAHVRGTRSDPGRQEARTSRYDPTHGRKLYGAARPK